MTTLDRIRANRARRARAAASIEQLDTELTGLVRHAFEDGYTWQQLAELLGVSKARVYQIREGTR